MINDFDIYKKIYNFSNYIIYLNTKLIGNFISLGYKHLDFNKKYWECKNYEIYKSKIQKNVIKDNEFFFDKNVTYKEILNLKYFSEFSESRIKYCHFYINEKKEGILIYFKNKILYYKNIETLMILIK